MDTMLALLLAGFLGTNSTADPTLGSTRVFSCNHGESESSGSAFYLNSGVWATALHTIQADDASHPNCLTGPVVLNFNRFRDVALIHIPEGPPLSLQDLFVPPELASPRVGEGVAAVGGAFARARLDIRQGVALAGDAALGGFTTDAVIDSGMSGGPVFSTERSAVLGVVVKSLVTYGGSNTTDVLDRGGVFVPSEYLAQLIERTKSDGN